MPFFAHSTCDATGHSNVKLFQLLADHLRDVAAGSERRALLALPGRSDLAAAARLAGLLHDLGKYRPEFQQYILPDSPFAKGNPLTRHKEAGAAAAFDAGYKPVAFTILGHHGGIPDAADVPGSVGGPSGRPVAIAVRAAAAADCCELAGDYTEPPNVGTGLQADLLTRFLFSCLVDADWADTGAHERQVKGSSEEPQPPVLEPDARLTSVLKLVEDKAKLVGDTVVGKARAEVLAACLDAAVESPGLFSLTVPTGGGKTLAGLAFALKHAVKNNLRRIIYVAPYMTILEQNADAIRAALGVPDSDPVVFEHYSLAEPPGDTDPEETSLGSAARRAENWDAPVVVTTNVQFFESLFSNKPGRCRKLHNIARSVIVLDECQTLPPGLAAPTCGMLKQLAALPDQGGLGCSVVLCTATQPTFAHSSLQPDERLEATEIIPKVLRNGDANDLFMRLKRVGVTWPRKDDASLTWAEVAAKMRQEPSALCVVNTKKAARAVYDELKGLPGVFHLSTGMCPQHRREKLQQIKSLLKDNAPCYVVSTQLIEAGVDVDFPFLLREMAPLESVIQAAGRCNREGRIPDAGGRVVVFRSSEGKMPPDRWYNAGRDKLEQLIAARRRPADRRPVGNLGILHPPLPHRQPGQ